MSTGQRPNWRRKVIGVEKSRNLPPSLWFAALAKTECWQTNQSAHEVDGRVLYDIIQNEIAAREVARETRGVEAQLTGVFSSQMRP